MLGYIIKYAVSSEDQLIQGELFSTEAYEPAQIIEAPIFPPQTAPEPPLLNPDGGKPTPKAIHDATTSSLDTLIAEMQRGPSPHLLHVLEFGARFYKYSSQNQFLIQLQAPDARYVQSFDDWKKMGYRIRTGAKAIYV